MLCSMPCSFVDTVSILYVYFVKESQQPESATGPTITSSAINVEVEVKRSESATRSSVPIEVKKSESTTGTSSLIVVKKSESTTGTSSLIEVKKLESITGTSSLVDSD